MPTDARPGRPRTRAWEDDGAAGDTQPVPVLGEDGAT